MIVETYALSRAHNEMDWGIAEMKAFLPSLAREDCVRNESRRRGPGLIWMFQRYIDDHGDNWVELVLFDAVLVVSFHPSDGEGEP